MAVCDMALSSRGRVSNVRVMAAGVWQSVAKRRLRLESRERAGEESLGRGVGCHDGDIILLEGLVEWRWGKTGDEDLMWESACCVEGLAAAAAPEMLEYVIGGVDLRLTGRDGKRTVRSQSCSPAAHEHSRHTVIIIIIVAART